MIFARLIFQTAFLALGQIWANKVRAMLTALGIIIGVAAVVATVAATDGLRKYVLDQFQTFGAKKVFFDGTVPQDKRGTMSFASVQLTLEEVRTVERSASSLEAVTPIMHGAYEVQNGAFVLQSVSVTGIWPSWHEIESRYVTSGRPFSSIDEEQQLKVCLVNDKAIEELAMEQDPVGEYLLIKGRRFLIIGVVETKDLGPMFGGDSQSEIFIPFSTAATMSARNWINYALANLTTPEAAEDARAEISLILRKMRNLAPEDEDTFVVEVLQQIIDQFNGMAAAITAGAGGIVAISLLVGGIGIMNIMLVSVSERTREIGLRKAVGARPAVILAQFLVEAVVLCLVGGGIGLLIGQCMIWGLRAIPDSPLEHATVPAWAVALAVGFSAATGVVFGMFPAIKAARLDPIDALRHE